MTVRFMFTWRWLKVAVDIVKRWLKESELKPCEVKMMPKDSVKPLAPKETKKKGGGRNGRQ